MKIKLHTIIAAILLIPMLISGQSLIVDSAYFFDSGNLKYITCYKIIDSDTVYEGKAIFFYITGDIWQEGSYKNGEMSGSWSTKYTSGKLKRKASYVDGKKNGKIVNYYESGNPSLVLNYKMDSLCGLATLYYENRQIKETRYYKNNKLNG